MEELKVFVVYCNEGSANFAFHVAERNAESAVKLVEQKRPRVTVISHEPNELFTIAGFPTIRKMEAV